MVQAKKSMQLDPIGLYNSLDTIVKQVQATRESNRDVMNASRMWDKLADTTARDTGSFLAAYKELDAGLLDRVSRTARELSEALNPLAKVAWTETDLEKLILGVRTCWLNGMYSDDDNDEINATLAAANQALKKGAKTVTGTRAGNGEGSKVDGRPAFVKVYIGGNLVTTAIGDGPSSVGNIANGIVHRIEKALGEPLPAVDVESIKTIVKSCVVGGASPVSIGDGDVTLEHSATK